MLKSPFRLMCCFFCLLPAFLPSVTHAQPQSLHYRWRNVQIVGGGFVDGIIFNPAAKDVLYARTDIGGAYRWDYQNHRWIPLMDEIMAKDWNLMGVESIGVDPVNPNRVYFAVGTYTNSWAGNGAILRSDDQGRTWQKTDLPFQVGGNMDGRFAGERLAVDPNDDAILYFGSRNNGLWKSMDYGATWSQVMSFPVQGATNGIGTVFVLFQRSSGRKGKATPVIYAGVQQDGPSLYESTDSGSTWEAVPGQPAGLLPNHGEFGADNTLYLTYGNAPGPNGMSAGAVWKLDLLNGNWTNISPVMTGQPGASGYGGLAVDAQHPSTIMVSTMDRWNPGDTIFRSLNGGASWNDIGPNTTRNPSASPWVTFGKKTAPLGWWLGALAINPYDSGNVLYGTGATIWESRDVTHADQGLPTHWTVGAKGLEETAVLQLISPPYGAQLCSSLGDIGAYRHENLDVSPPRGMLQPVMYNVTWAFAQNDPGMLVRTGNGPSGIYGVYSSDDGGSWTAFPTLPAGTSGGGPVALSTEGKTIVWTPKGSVPSVTHDHGAEWAACQGLPAAATIAADGVNASLFYALDPKTGILYTSHNSGASFTETRTFTEGNDALCVEPDAEGDLWVVANGTLMHCPDDAAEATPLTTIQGVGGFGFGKAAPGHSHPALYASGTVDGLNGIFRSIDNGATWDCITDSDHQFATRNVIIGDPRIFGRVYVGTNGRGILYGDPVTPIRKK